MTMAAPEATPRRQQPDAPLVDTHVHVFRKGMPLIPDPRHTPSYEFTAEQLQATLDAHGVKLCVIAAASPWGDCNDYIAQSLREHPLWRGTAILEPSTSRHELEQLARDGMVGVRLPFISLRELPDLDSWEYRRFLWRLADLDWHVHLHLDGPRIPQVLPQLERSGVKIVIDHIGRPDPVLREKCAGFEAVARSVEKGRTWVKLSGGYRLGAHSAALAQELCGQVGYERMLWASDCPFVGVESTTYQSTIDWLDQAVPDPRNRRILDRNAIDLYFSGARSGR
jgi:predicted TIM-barrel fold metal-dependent hydrolase